MASYGDDKRVEEKKGTKRHIPTDSRGHKSRHRNPNSGSGDTYYNQIGMVHVMQIGSNNKMYVNSRKTSSGPYTRSQAQQSCTKNEELTEEQSLRLTKLQGCLDEVNSQMMSELSKSWERSWFNYGKLLKLTETCLKNIEDDVKENSDKRREAAFQVLVTWKKQTDDPSVKNLISLLTKSGDYTSILSLLKE